MKEKPSYYAVIPAEVRYDKRLNAGEKLLYGEISCLSNKKGYCWAANSYFSEVYEVSERTIQRWLNDLREYGYITCYYSNDENNKTNRLIYIGEKSKEEPVNQIVYDDDNVFVF